MNPKRMFDRCLPAVVAVLLAGCASIASAPPLVVEFLETGYLVDNSVLTSPAELQAYLVDHRVRQVRLVPMGRTTPAHVDETVAAVRNAGVDLVGTGRSP